MMPTNSTLEDVLLDHHLHQLRVESAIPDELIIERGYRSVDVAADLLRLGFKQRQARTPALLIPIHGVDGELVGHAIRPDEPRTGGGGMIKYEMPAGWKQRLDVPPRCRPQLHDPSVPLYLTEGAKKADSLAAVGTCAISLNGVWAWRGTNEQGGKTALADWDSVALNERLVRIVFDSDVSTKKEVRYALVRLTAFLESRGAVVEIIYLPPAEDDRKQGVDDFLAAGGTLAALNQFAVTEVAPAADDAEEIQRTIVVSTRHLREISTECWEVIEQWNDRKTFIFQHGGLLTRVELNDGEGPRLIDINLDSLAFFLDRACDFIKITDEGPIPARLPADVARDLLITWNKPVPAIRGIVGAPTFTADGVLATTTGYQPDTELYYLPVGEPVSPVPDAPTIDDLKRARKLLLDEWLVDFPFPDEASRAHALAVALTPIVRELIDGPTPLFAIDAPTPGTGKGLLAETIGTLVFGTTPPVMSELRNDEELRKRITSVLLSGAPIILFDNVSKKVASGVFAAALTAPIWSDRRLGGNETINIPNRATWMITGNNLDLSGEIARRTVWLRIDPDTDRPWERTGFRNFPLPAWVRAHRHELLWSLLVLAQNWIASGKPAWSGKPMGTFESWSQVVGGILEHTGIAGFLGNRDELYRNVDTESEEWRAFVAAWWEQHESNPVKVADLTPLVRDGELLSSVFANLRDDASERSLRTKLGRALAQRRDRWFGDLHVVSLGLDPHSKVSRYRLETRSDEVPPGPAEVPQQSSPVSQVFAGPAGLAGPLLASDEVPRETDTLEAEPSAGMLSLTEPETTPDQVPQVPHPPQTQQLSEDQPTQTAGPPPSEVFQVTQEVTQPADAHDREPCRGGCGTHVPLGQRCPECASAAVVEWKNRPS